MNRKKILAVLVLSLMVLGLGFMSPGGTRPEADGLGIRVDDLGYQMAKTGVIDSQKFLSLYASNPALKAEAEQLLAPGRRGTIAVTEENSGLILNYFWALGLGNKNGILEMEMMDPQYGGAGNFASTGGWTLARGDAMEHYNMHEFIKLTPAEQELVDRVSRNIYRPCCGNSTHFPDCNHGMAMLGFLELMARDGATEEEMYRAALRLNSFWFPDTYKIIAQYKKERGVAWEEVDPKEILSAEYSSARGFQNIASQVVQPAGGAGASCGV